jgi:copper transport protein
MFTRATAMMRALIFATLLLASLATNQAALAHAVLLETSPANGAILKTAPREVVLRFNETVAPIALTLVGRDGPVVIPPESIAVRDTMLHAVLPHQLPTGSYIVSYRVVSADSHPVSGAFLFAVGAPSRAAPTAPDLSDQENRWAFLVILNRILLLAGLLFSAGGILFAAAVLCGEATLVAPLVRPLRIGAAITIATAVLAVALQGGLLTAGQMDAASLEQDAAVGWHSTLGTSAALIAFGMLLMLLSLGRPWRLRLGLGVAGAILAAGALAASGHAATAPPRWLATPAMAAHGLVIAFWAGSLWPLLHVLRLRGAGAAEVVLRFSRAAVIAVAILIASGLILAGLQLDGDPAALVTTPYGQLLLLKLGLVALLLALATYNKFRLTPALTRGEDGAVSRLARSIRLEIAAVGLILAVTVLLGQAPPPRALAMAESTAQPIHGSHIAPSGRRITLQARGYTAVVAVAPAKVGRNTITVSLRTPDGSPFAPLEATAEISLPDQGIEPLSRTLNAIAPGRYRWTTDGFLRPGDWHLSLGVLINDFERVTFETIIAIGD